jgi:hypothetical protein
MPKVRKPKSRSQALWGGGNCGSCGCEMDKWGREINAPAMIVEKSPLQCAGINRHEVEDERALRGRSSEPLGPEFCVVPREGQGEA